jgi:ketosteroid isomerase-like protein
MKRMALLTVLVACCLAGGAAAQQRVPEDVNKLCGDTVAALQKTDAAPLANLFSVQASSFLAAQGEQVIHLGRTSLKDKETWADQPLFGPMTFFSEIKYSERLYAGRIEAKVSDGEKDFLLDGVCLSEGQGKKWLMLMVRPAQEPADAEVYKGQLLQWLMNWQGAFRRGDIDGLASPLAEKDLVLVVVGPDYGFYVLSDAAQVKALLGQAIYMGAVEISTVNEPIIEPRPPVALVAARWSITAGGMQASTLDAYIHLYLDNGQWRVAAIAGLPPAQ